MLRFSHLVFSIAALGFIAAAGCNSGSSTNPNPLPSGVLGPCSIAGGGQAFMVSPAAQSTGNSSSFQQVIVAFSAPLTSQTADAAIQYPNGTYAYGNPFVAAQPPGFGSPIPPFAAPYYYVSTFSTQANFNGALPAASTITVGYNDLNSPCTPLAISTFATL